jgi:hypothetical protein
MKGKRQLLNGFLLKRSKYHILADIIHDFFSKISQSSKNDIQSSSATYKL